MPDSCAVTVKFSVFVACCRSPSLLRWLLRNVGRLAATIASRKTAVNVKVRWTVVHGTSHVNVKVRWTIQRGRHHCKMKVRWAVVHG